ncbi:MAG: hypothetical protein KDA51_17300 [Planctomycetales bacterium]|nr:hypothetical protein [Planctomycetales bacterium]MCA9183225.1 hypothetical protein [Planctomycetales bacterium]
MGISVIEITLESPTAAVMAIADRQQTLGLRTNLGRQGCREQQPTDGRR